MTKTPEENQASARRTPALVQPAFLDSWLVWAGLALVFLIPFFLPIPQGLRRHPVIGTLGEQLHVPLLACLALLIYWKGPLRGRIWYSAGTAALLGALIEFTQELVGRTALFEDWLMDLVGIGYVVGFVLWRGQGSRAGKWLFLVLLLYIPGQLWRLPLLITAEYEAKHTFPVLADFEGKHFRWLWKETYASTITVAAADSTRGHTLRISSGPPSRWPGAKVVRFPHDWSGFTELAVEARLVAAAGDSLRFGIRVDDFRGRQDKVWIGKSFHATRQWQTFALPVAGRKVMHGDRFLDLDDVESVLVFVGTPQDSFTLEIDNLRLR